MNTPNTEDVRKLRNIWAAAYTNFDEYLKSGEHTSTEIKAMLLSISTEVFNNASYLTDNDEIDESR